MPELWEDPDVNPNDLPPTPMRGKIAGVVASVDDLVYVTIDAFDGGVHHHGPCPWTPRVDAAGALLLPSDGDACIVVEDEQEQPWILVWWPYAL